ncbi:MAG: chloride channel protein [Bacteroidales bacterium]|nr:chloride channel protein [Bacteroidales bacterium]
MLWILAVVTGLLSGLAAVLLKQSIGLLHRLVTGVVSGGPYHWAYLVTPGVGMLLSLLFVRYIVRDKIGHGVTRVLKAISRNEAHIRPHNTYSSLVASSLTIGLGGSVGAEAPIVYTGAAIGSNIARVLHLPYRQITILLGCGAAGALAGIFKAPIAGVLFTLEILMFNISMTSILPLLFSSVSATMVTYLLMGDTVTFSGSIVPFALSNIPFYVLLGLVCGMMSLYFLRTTLRVEDKLGKMSNPFIKWIFCAVLLGILIFLFPPLYGEGFDALAAMLDGELPDLVAGALPERVMSGKWTLLLFFAAVMFTKVYATAFTNAGGGVGGTFGPTMFTGAVTGFVLAKLMGNLGIAQLPMANFTLVGMAGLMAGVMQAPLTAIFLIAEMSGGYALMFPLMITSAISFATIRFFEQYSIYSKRIAQQGDLLTHDSDKAVLTLLRTVDFIETDFKPIGLDNTLGDLVKIIATSNRNIVPVLDDDGLFRGLVMIDDVRHEMFNESLYDTIHIYDLVKDAPAILSVEERMESVMDAFERTGAWNLPVTDPEGRYVGFVSKSKILSPYRDQLHQVSHD